MTPCEAIGYRVGDLFTYIDDEVQFYPTGTELKLVKDDSSLSPLFIDTSDGLRFYLHLSLVEPINLSLENE